MSSGFTPGFVDVYVNGIKLSDEDFNDSSSPTISFTSALELGDQVCVVSVGTVEFADLYTKSEVDALVGGVSIDIDIKIGSEPISSVVYNGNGDPTTVNYTAGYKVVYTYDPVTNYITQIQYYDNDSVTLLLTKTINYAGDNVISTTRT